MDLQSLSKNELIYRIQQLEAELKSYKRTSGTYNMSLELQSSVILKKRFESGQKKNPKFSLRSFAKKVGISAGKISAVFNGQYILSREMAQRITKNLDFADDQKEAFLEAVEQENSNLEEFRDFMKSISNKEGFFSKKLHNLETEEDVKLLDHWTFYGIMAALELKTCDHSLEWMAQTMKLDKATTQERLETMTKLGIVENRDGLYYLIPKGNFNNGVPTSPRASQIAATKCSVSAYNYMADRFAKQIITETSDSDLQNNVYFFINAVDSSKIGNIPEFIAQSTYKSLDEMAASANRDTVYMVNLAFLKV